MINTYITEIETKILKRKYVNSKTHIVPKDNIILNYSNYNIEKEYIYINNSKVEHIYNSSFGNVLVTNFKPNSDSITIKVDYNNRIQLLKSLTCRLLIESTLKKYYNLEATDFYTSKESSNFSINGIFFDKDANELIKTLEKNINEYIKYPIEIIQNKEENLTSIKGLFSTKYFPYTLSNIGEINNFKIISFNFNNSGVKFSYSTK